VTATATSREARRQITVRPRRTVRITETVSRNRDRERLSIAAQIAGNHVHPFVLDRGTVPDLMALAEGTSPPTRRRPRAARPAFLLRAIGAIPGVTRLLRLVMNRADRYGLRKEGYDDIAPAAGGRRRAQHAGTENPNR
jgi:hypothetical protein